MKWIERKTIIWHIAISILGVACFPANPLVFAGVIKTKFHPALFALGWIIWAIGMVLVMAPIIMFPKRGGVPKGKSFVHTTKLVDTGIYAVVRHPQYLGGILSIFLTTLLWHPHWLFALLGTLGAFVLYVSTRIEDRRLIEQYGSDYLDYMRRVPRMNIVLGLIRILRHRKSEI
jgi:protein-S-isoprenylcysteine O-methyltransferase Ste14